ncbi:MAG: hypothetical protein K2Z80_25750, partial [Xanthobacteraceae bacterium]|nr:hypothetical protein [Xanthobacteraceae bacterium]
MPNEIYLTKTRYTAGLQCLRRLWLNVHQRAGWNEAEAGSVEAVGAEIGRMAHRLFPGGALIEEAPWEHRKAMTRTASQMADPSVPAIFEAAFEASGVRIRVDILERLPRGWWGLREVKSSSEVKEHHHDDVAVQLHVLRKAGVRVASVQVLHINKNYVRGPNGMLWPKFFSRVDVKRESKKRLAGIEARIQEQLRCLSRAHEPKIEPDAHCHSPYSCEHWERCTASKPADWVFYLPHLNASRRAELTKLGIETISAIPDDFSLSPRQTVIRDVTRSRKPHVDSDLAKRLRACGIRGIADRIPTQAGQRSDDCGQPM